MFWKFSEYFGIKFIWWLVDGCNYKSVICSLVWRTMWKNICSATVHRTPGTQIKRSIVFVLSTFSISRKDLGQCSFLLFFFFKTKKIFSSQTAKAINVRLLTWLPLFYQVIQIVWVQSPETKGFYFIKTMVTVKFSPLCNLSSLQLATSSYWHTSVCVCDFELVHHCSHCSSLFVLLIYLLQRVNE